MDNLSNLAQRLNELMEEHDLRSEGLAKKSGVAGSSIRAILRGESLPSLDSVVKLADYFHCSLDYLIGKTDKIEEVKPRPLPSFYEHLRAIMKELGIKRYAITTKTSINDTCFTNWKHGSKPSLSNVCILASYMKISLDELVGRID